MASAKENRLSRTPTKASSRIALRIRPADKALLTRAATISGADMTDFILRTVLGEAQAIIEKHERIKLSERDSKMVLELLENPPSPNAKLRKAARALPKDL
jgi:uncharacterized protein (DUF1778 family)